MQGYSGGLRNVTLTFSNGTTLLVQLAHGGAVEGALLLLPPPAEARAVRMLACQHSTVPLSLKAPRMPPCNPVVWYAGSLVQRGVTVLAVPDGDARFDASSRKAPARLTVTQPGLTITISHAREQSWCALGHVRLLPRPRTHRPVLPLTPLLTPPPPAPGWTCL